MLGYLHSLDDDEWRERRGEKIREEKISGEKMRGEMERRGVEEQCSLLFPVLQFFS